MISKARKALSHGRNAHRRHHARKPRLLVVCAGAVTEKIYFDDLEAKHNIVITYKAYNLSPSQLADKARELAQDSHKKKNEEDPYVHCFVVADVDDYPPENFDKAQSICKKCKIPTDLIVSNPCFEVWLIDYDRACPLNATVTKIAEDIAKKMQLTHGSRNKYIATEKIFSGDAETEKKLEDTAIKNAQKHNKNLTDSRQRWLPNAAPYTDMPTILNIIRELSDKHQEL